jgi:hypothetical protein
MGQFLAPNNFERLAYFWLKFFAAISERSSFWAFWMSLLHESQIFDKQLSELPNLQDQWSVVQSSLLVFKEN